ncbi:NAD(P)-binding protein [Schizophyllum commune H4-8]|nr:NAD(P)-binding protein [Schizophyllum commune H4-8]KAI5888688.1 NAD(P)-binding protein [Schizophyllum commune H4-8]
MVFSSFQTFVLIVIAAAAYIKLNDSRLGKIPPRALQFSPKRVKPEDILLLRARLEDETKSIDDQMPPVTGRRYIVIGGTGFLGGWLVLHLIRRGEDPENIRVIDLHPPSRPDLLTDEVKGVAFFQADITNRDAVDRAFDLPWPNGDSSGLTVFNTAANILFYERCEMLMPRSTRVNVDGLQNLLDASLRVGASIFVQTSSGTVTLRRSRYLLWPWEREPRHFVRVLNEDDALVCKRHEDHWSNYAASKCIAERHVRAADDLPSGTGTIRTGILRPGNGIYGPGGDAICSGYLNRGTNPSWYLDSLQSFIYIENCSLAHLLYEQRLLARERGDDSCPDIGGGVFVVTDPGPPQTYGDIGVALTVLSGGQCTFIRISSTLMLLVAYAIEMVYVARHWLLIGGRTQLAGLLPSLRGLVAALQPSLWDIAGPRLIFDDSRARLPPEQGGLGYRGVWTTMEGVVRTHQAFVNGVAVTQRWSADEDERMPTIPAPVQPPLKSR